MAAWVATRALNEHFGHDQANLRISANCVLPRAFDGYELVVLSVVKLKISTTTIIIQKFNIKEYSDEWFQYNTTANLLNLLINVSNKM